MELKEKFDVLKQAAQAAQSKGILSLDDAVYVKKAFDCIDTNTNLDIAVKILSNVINVAQVKGCYSLKDAYILYIVLNSIGEDIAKLNTPKEKPEENVCENKKEEKK